MKKVLALMLAVMMLCSLSACSEGQGSDENAQRYGYDGNSTENMITFIVTTGEKACTETEMGAEQLLEKIGDSYEGYIANKVGVTAYYEQLKTRSEELYAAIYACSIDYFECVAANGLDNYNVWNEAMGAFYEEWNEVMVDFYEEWNDACGDLYEEANDIINDAANEIPYSEYSNTWGAMYEEFNDTWSALYDAYNAAWNKEYDTYSACWNGFYEGEENVTAILQALEKEETHKEDKQEEKPDAMPVTGASCEQLEEEIASYTETKLGMLFTEWERLAAAITDYDSYVSHSEEVKAFYAKAEQTSGEICVQMCRYAIEYAEAVLASGASCDDMYDAVDGIYDLLYDDMGDEIYDGIYDGLFDELYDALYDGALDDRPDSVEYSAWSDVRSDEYDLWSDTRSEAYDQWSDARSDVYDFWSDVRDELYDEDPEKAREEIEDFRADIVKMEQKLSKSETTPVSTEQQIVVSKGVSPSFKAAMDSYEAFFDEYVAFVAAYKESEDITGMAAEYTAMMSRYLETMTALQEIDQESLSDEEALYYAEVMLRINQKLLEAA